MLVTQNEKNFALTYKVRVQIRQYLCIEKKHYFIVKFTNPLFTCSKTVVYIPYVYKGIRMKYKWGKYLI